MGACILIVAVCAIQFLGGPDAAALDHRMMRPDFAPHSAYMMRGPHHMGFFRFIGSLLSLLFWTAVGIGAFLWFRRKRAARSPYPRQLYACARSLSLRRHTA